MTTTLTATAPAHAEHPFPQIPLDAIAESKTNPRKHFDKAALAELTESIRTHGVLQPILVRPLAPGRYELVAGARRFRAAKAAGLEEIPAAVRELDDKQVLEVQVIENLQRADLSPLEEARGYELLHKRHGYAVDELAAKLGKSKAYVYSRMKLCALPKGAQKLLDEGLLDASRALLVARIPVPELAEKAAREIAFGTWQADQPNPKTSLAEPMAYREAVEHVQHEYMLRLKDAPFPTGDPTLVPAAKACGTCPKRTGNQRGLFDDVSSADVCTDPKCFEAKCDAWFARRAAAIQEKGGNVIDAPEADRRRFDPDLVSLDDPCYADPKNRHFRALLGKAIEDLKPTLLRYSQGEIQEKYAAADVRKALKAKGYAFASKLSGAKLTAAGPTRSEQDRKREAAHRRRVAAAKLALPDLIAAAEQVDEASLLRFLICQLEWSSFDAREVLKRRGFAGVRGAKPSLAGLSKLGLPQLRGLVVEMVAGKRASALYSTGYLAAWSAACEFVGIDMKKFESQVPKAGAKASAKKNCKKAAPVAEASGDDDDLDDAGDEERST